MLPTACCQLPTGCCWLLVTGCWLLVAGFKFLLVFVTQTPSQLSNWGTKQLMTGSREFLCKDDFEAKLLHLKKK